MRKTNQVSFNRQISERIVRSGLVSFAVTIITVFLVAYPILRTRAIQDNKNVLKAAVQRMENSLGVADEYVQSLALVVEQNEKIRRLTAEITHVEREIEKCDTKISNLSDFTKQSVEISSKLRTYWEQKDFKLCQKIQKLTFPEGIKWDAKNKAFRTDGENKFLAKIAFLGTSVEASIKEEPNKSCDLSGLVAEAGLEPTTSGL